MGKMKSFTASTARPLPVIILADVSGSMGANGKIQALNEALSELVRSFQEEGEEGARAQLQVAVIAFGETAQLHLPLTPVNQVALSVFSAAGCTPMGAAFAIVRNLLQDREQIPSRAYAPAIVLVSDGMPTDDWEGPLAELLSDERAQKAQRFALGIGADADAVVLRRFLADSEGTVYVASDAAKIKTFFRWVTMSVSVRSRSISPNTVDVPSLPSVDLDELL